MMEISYICDGTLLTTSITNSDLEIEETKGQHNKVTITALKDIMLNKAIINDIHKISKDDLFFLNGYHSWSKTKLSHLSDKEKDLSKLPSFILDKVSLVEYGDTFIYDYDKNKLHGYDFFYLQGESEFFSFNLNLCFMIIL